eukprot:jgi/Botrbrau1/8753/Bobra.0090s0027.1
MQTSLLGIRVPPDRRARIVQPSGWDLADVWLCTVGQEFGRYIVGKHGTVAASLTWVGCNETVLCVHRSLLPFNPSLGLLDIDLLIPVQTFAIPVADGFDALMPSSNSWKYNSALQETAFSVCALFSSNKTSRGVRLVCESLLTVCRAVLHKAWPGCSCSQDTGNSQEVKIVWISTANFFLSSRDSPDRARFRAEM